MRIGNWQEFAVFNTRGSLKSVRLLFLTTPGVVSFFSRYKQADEQYEARGFNTDLEKWNPHNTGNYVHC